MIKWQFKCIAITLSVLLLFACSEPLENKISTKERDLLTNLISNHNAQLQQNFGVNTPEIKKAFVINESLENFIYNNKDSQSIIINPSESLKFQIDLDKSIDFPKSIDNAEIFFAGNQLILLNYDNNDIINFYVENEGYSNQTKWIDKSISVNSIGIERAPNG